MAVNSKADKKGKHTVSAVVVPGNPKGKLTAQKSYASGSTSPTSSALVGVLPAGAKALGLRAKAILNPTATPNASIAD